VPLDRRHSASTSEQKLTFDSQRNPAAQQYNSCRPTTGYLTATSRPNGSDGPLTVGEVYNNVLATSYLSVKSELTGRSSDDDDEIHRQSLNVSRRQAPDVHFSISSSRSLTGIESAVLQLTVADDDSDVAVECLQQRRAMTTPTKRRRPLRQRTAVKNRGAELTTIWINQHTDDSEVERRVERLLYEIDHSVTDSVDDSKIQSQEFEMLSD